MTEIPYGYCHCGCGQKTGIAARTDRLRRWTKGEPKKFIVNHHQKIYNANPKRRPLVDRFWERVNKTDDKDSCWEWKSKPKKHGYCTITKGGTKGKSLLAHRVSYEIAYGEIPPGLRVCHSCDNPVCCNPNHLFLGTDLDNARDKCNKGRQAKGERSGTHKLTAMQVKTIRNEYATGCVTCAELGNRFGVNGGTISSIIRYKSWKDE